MEMLSKENKLTTLKKTKDCLESFSNRFFVTIRHLGVNILTLERKIDSIPLESAQNSDVKGALKHVKYSADMLHRLIDGKQMDGIDN